MTERTPGPAETYAAVTKQVEMMLRIPYPGSKGAPERQRAYMIARAALLVISHAEGLQRAAELAYQLADEMATGR